MSGQGHDPSDTRRDTRRYAVSANRGRARHPLRYVESGGGEPDANCRVCAPVVQPRTESPPAERSPTPWDQRYNRQGYLYGREPNDFLAAHVAELPAGGDILCLADGEGRNSVFLAARGFRVTAVDQSAVGLEKAQDLARENGVTINTVQADLADWPLGHRRWDGIVSIFCHLPPPIRHRVHAQVGPALKPGGVLLLEAYTPEQLQLGTGGPPGAELMMTATLLRTELHDLHFTLLRELRRTVIEGEGHTGTGAVVQAVAYNQMDIRG